MSDSEISAFLSILKEIGQESWLQHEQNILGDPTTPFELKEDFSNVLDVVNMVFENQEPHLSIQRFKELSESQQKFLLAFVTVFSDDRDVECDCPNCTEKNDRERFRQQKELSDNRIYPISETIYRELYFNSIEYHSMIAKLNQTVELLPEDDPRFQFAMQLLSEHEL